MKRIFYEKVSSRYKPVSEWDHSLLESLPQGSHLVMCYPGGKSTRYNVDPAYAPLIAASRVAERTIADLIVDASEMQPSKVPITTAQRDAWYALSEAFGTDMYTINRPSANDIAEAAMTVLQEEANKLMQHEAVRLAYEHFMLVCKLTSQKESQ
jgi:hypothetical protein